MPFCDKSFAGRSLLVFLAAASLLGLGGCARPGPFVKIQRLFIGKRWTDTVPGVVPPYQKIEEIRRLGKHMATAPEPEREQLARRLVEAYQAEDDPNVRWEIFRACGDTRSPEGQALVELALHDPEPDLRIAACERLGRWRGPEAASRLAAVATQDQSRAVRLAAVRALGRVKDPAALPVLAEMLEDRDPAFQYQAMAALKELTGQNLGWDAERWRNYLISRYQLAPSDRGIARGSPGANDIGAR